MKKIFTKCDQVGYILRPVLFILESLFEKKTLPIKVSLQNAHQISKVECLHSDFTVLPVRAENFMILMSAMSLFLDAHFFTSCVMKRVA